MHEWKKLNEWRIRFSHGGILYFHKLHQTYLYLLLSNLGGKNSNLKAVCYSENRITTEWPSSSVELAGLGQPESGWAEERSAKAFSNSARLVLSGHSGERQQLPGVEHVSSLCFLSPHGLDYETKLIIHPRAYFRFATLTQLRALHWEQEAICHYYYCYALTYLSHLACLSLFPAYFPHPVCTLSTSTVDFSLWAGGPCMGSTEANARFVFIFVSSLRIKARSHNKRVKHTLGVGFYVMLQRYQNVWSPVCAYKKSYLV